jgi:hypothetical protein
MSDYPPELVEAVAVELASISGKSWMFSKRGNDLGRETWRLRAVDLLDLIDRQGALYRTDSGPDRGQRCVS